MEKKRNKIKRKQEKRDGHCRAVPCFGRSGVCDYVLHNAPSSICAITGGSDSKPCNDALFLSVTDTKTNKQNVPAFRNTTI
jgi:hypothetical protein